MDILNLLELIKKKIEQLEPVPEKFLVSQGNNNGFEKLVPSILDQIREKHSLVFEYEEHYGHHFPDITITMNNRKYGIELKSRNNGTFDTNGNSVFESISNVNYDEIFILFGSHNRKDQKPKIKVKYLPYWRAAHSIVVTHSPRFKINMSGNQSVFESSEQYNLLRSKDDIEKVEFLQDYLRNNIEGTKWFVSKKQTEVPPIPLNTLDIKVQNRIVSEVLILFPQDIFKSITNEKQRSDYTRASQYIIAQHYYFSSSFRDYFSSGGTWKVNSVTLPKVFKKLQDNRNLIMEILNESSNDFQKVAYKSWSEMDLDLDSDFTSDYCSVLEYLGKIHFPKTLQTAGINSLTELLR